MHWAASYVSLVRDAAQAASQSARRNQMLPLGVFPERRFPALSLLPGHIPAHFANPAGAAKLVHVGSHFRYQRPGCYVVDAWDRIQQLHRPLQGTGWRGGGGVHLGHRGTIGSMRFRLWPQEQALDFQH